MKLIKRSYLACISAACLLFAIPAAHAQTVTKGYVTQTATISYSNTTSSASVSYSITDENDNGSTYGIAGYPVNRVNHTVSGSNTYTNTYVTGASLPEPIHYYTIGKIPAAGAGFVAWIVEDTYYKSNVSGGTSSGFSINNTWTAYLAVYSRQNANWTVSTLWTFAGGNNVDGPYLTSNSGAAFVSVAFGSSLSVPYIFVYGYEDLYTGYNVHSAVNVSNRYPLASQAIDWTAPTLSSTAPTSSNATITAGTAWTPTISAGTGNATLYYCVAGQTNYDTVAWTPPSGSGSYTFYVAATPTPGYSGNVSDPILGAMEVNATAYTLTVNAIVSPQAMIAPTSVDSTIADNGAWTPLMTGGSGVATYYYCIGGLTNFQTGPWSPPGPGTYTFYVAASPQSGYTGNVTDPHLGSLEENGIGYTLTATSPLELVISPPVSIDASATVGVPWTPTMSAGTGNGTLYFCIGGVTNFQTSAWTPTTAGTYSFFVASTPVSGYHGNVTDPILGNMETTGTPYVLTVH